MAKRWKVVYRDDKDDLQTYETDCDSDAEQMAEERDGLIEGPFEHAGGSK